MKRSLLVSLFILCGLNVAHAAEKDLNKDLDSLGGNEQILRRAKALDPKNKVEVVQNRLVDRHNRIEIGGNYGIASGNSYLFTQDVGLTLDYHINPHWSLGARYYNSYNSLTPQGRQVMDQAQKDQQTTGSFSRPDIDSPLSTYLGVVEFYPVYGKLNWFDKAVTQFDLYMLGGYGKVNLVSGQSDAYTAGLGIGIWLTQHVATRIESRWEAYQDFPGDQSRTLNTVVTTLSIGILL